MTNNMSYINFYSMLSFIFRTHLIYILTVVSSFFLLTVVSPIGIFCQGTLNWELVHHTMKPKAKLTSPDSEKSFIRSKMAISG